MSHQEQVVAEVPQRNDPADGLAALIAGLSGAGSLAEVMNQMRMKNLPKISLVEAEAKIDVIADAVIAELSRGPELLPEQFPNPEDAVMYYARGHIAALLGHLDHDDLVSRLATPIDTSTFAACKASLRNDFVREALVTDMGDGIAAFDEERAETLQSYVAGFWEKHQAATAADADDEEDTPVELHPEQQAAKLLVAPLMHKVIDRVLHAGLGDSPNEIMREFSARLLSQSIVDFLADKELTAKSLAPFVSDIDAPSSVEELMQQYARQFVLPFVIKIDTTNPVAEQQPWAYIEAGEAEVFAKLDLILAM